MKKKYFLKITALFAFTLYSALAYSQVNLYTQDFDEMSDFDTYQLYNSGGTPIGFSTVGSDYIVRANPGTLPVGNSVSGFSGNVIALEDVDIGFSGADRIDINSFSIAGAVDLSLTVRIAAPRGNDGGRYENGDFLRVQVSIDGGAFNTIISAAGATNGSGLFFYDTNNDGNFGNPGDQIIDQSAEDQLINVPFLGAGANLVVRFLFNSDGSHEEMMFDDISVDAVSSTLSTESFTLDNAFSVSPNPSNGTITIGNSGIALDKVQITDLNGRAVFNENLNGTTDSKELDLSSVLSSGMYLMTLTSDNTSTVKKLIIK